MILNTVCWLKVIQFPSQKASFYCSINIVLDFLLSHWRTHVSPGIQKSNVCYFLCCVGDFIGCKEYGCFSKRAGFIPIGQGVHGPQNIFMRPHSLNINSVI